MAEALGVSFVVRIGVRGVLESSHDLPKQLLCHEYGLRDERGSYLCGIIGVRESAMKPNKRFKSGN